MRNKKERRKNNRNIKAIALSEIFIFIISSFAFAFILGGMAVISSRGVNAALTSVVNQGDYFLYNGQYYQSNKAISVDLTSSQSGNVFATLVSTPGQVTKLNSAPTGVTAIKSISSSGGALETSTFNLPAGTSGAALNVQSDATKVAPPTAAEVPTATLVSSATTAGQVQVVTISSGQVQNLNAGTYIYSNGGKTLTSQDGKTYNLNTTVSATPTTLTAQQTYIYQNGGTDVSQLSSIPATKATVISGTQVLSSTGQLTTFNADGSILSTSKLSSITTANIDVGTAYKYSGIGTGGVDAYKSGSTWYEATSTGGKTTYTQVSATEAANLDKIAGSTAQSSLISADIAKDTTQLGNLGFTSGTATINGVTYTDAMVKGNTTAVVDGKVYTKDATTGQFTAASLTTSGGITAATEEKYSILGLKTVSWGGFWGHLGGNLIEGVEYAALAYGIVSTLKSAGIIPDNWATALGPALFGGIIAGKLAYGVMRGSISSTKFFGEWGTGTSWLIGVAVAYYIFATKYKKTDYKEQSIEFRCLDWQAPRGGADCDKCNLDPQMPCSEYRCRALGQTCKLINAGTGQDKCIDSSPDDVTSPGIKPWTQVLTAGYAYTDVTERPPGDASTPGKMSITYNGGCLKAFTPFEFGIITTDDVNGVITTQPAQCMIDSNHTTKMSDMRYWMGDTNLFVENHSQVASMPGTQLLQTLFSDANASLTVNNDGNYTFYVRCRDGNGNENRDEFAIRFCIDKTPDLTAPVIEAVSLPSGSPVQYQIDNVSVNVYTNEPASCRWSRKDSSYSNMENQMACTNNVWEMNAQMYYTCTTTLTAIADREENKFYFRCNDWSGNNMTQSYEYSLMGTQPLDITDVGPTGTVGTSTNVAVVNLTVKTDNGFNKGDSTCYYSKTSNENDYTEMFQTGGSSHLQTLDLEGGNYNYYYKCVDAGGNAAYNSTNFTVFVDKYAPAVIRVFTTEGKIVVMTDESSTCKYSTTSCNFDMTTGVDMPYADSNVHYAEFKRNQYYYVKCSDKYNNQPNPSDCSITLMPYELGQSS